MIKIFKVSGDSLFPFYKNGQRVLSRKCFKNTKININDSVIFHKEPHGLMIKRVRSIDDKMYFVEGTTPFSVDSRDFGSIAYQDIQYKVICTLY